MAIHPCPSCDKKMRTPDDAEGKKLRCPHCQSMLVVAEVKELLGPPMEEGIFGGNGSAVWTHPAVKKEEIVSGKGGNIKEMLLVVFLNGKVASSQHIKDIKAGGGIPNFGGGGSANPF